MAGARAPGTAVFAEKDTDKVGSTDLAEALHAIEGRPWAEYGKKNRKPISQNQLANLLKPVGVAPEILRDGKRVARGYRLAQFAEAFERYLRSEGDSRPLHRYKCDEQRTSDTFQTVTPEADVTVQKCEKSNNDGLCNGVTVWNGGNGERERVCQHCGAPERPDSPVRSCWVEGEEYLLHAGCQREWLGDDLPIRDFLRRVP